MLKAYRDHVAERASQNIPPKPLNAEQVAGLVELLKAPPPGEEEALLELITERVPPGVDEAAYVKAGYLSAVAKGEAECPVIDRLKAVELLGNMHGGYNIETLVSLLESAELGEAAARELKHTLLVFEAFHDVAELAAKGNANARSVLQSWADGEWFTSKQDVPESIKVAVFKVTGETNTDDLSPAPDAWSRPDIPLHALAMYKMTRDGLDPRGTRYHWPDAASGGPPGQRPASGLRGRCGRHGLIAQVRHQLGTVVFWRGYQRRSQQTRRRYLYRWQSCAYFLQHHGRCGSAGL